MKIDRNNYILYFIDHFEGNLSRNEEEDLHRFLSENTDLKAELDEFSHYNRSASSKGYQHKNLLKKEISDLGEVNDDTIDEYSIAYLENDLKETEKEFVLEAVNRNAAYKRIFDLYQKTKLLPDLAIRYLNKKQLKHFALTGKILFRISGYAAAAAILIFVLIISNPFNSSQSTQETIAEVSDTTTHPEMNISKVEPEEVEENNIRTISVSKQETPILANAIIEKPGQDSKEPVKWERLQSQSIQSIEPGSKLAINVIKIQSKSVDYAENSMESNDEIEPEQIPASANRRRISIWTLAELGMKGFGMLNERDYDVKPNYNNAGQVKSITLITENRRITIPEI